VKRRHVLSSAIRSVGYDASQRVLEVRYIDGDLYRYFDVPKIVARSLEEAPSKGQFINDVVKPTFRTEKVEEN
jgi:hypothetical protein